MASLSSPATAVTPSTRPPEERSLSPSFFAPATYITSSFFVSGRTISYPLSYFTGYPLEASITQQAHLSLNLTSVSARAPLVTACITVRRSLSSRGSTTCVSGSPKRQLYSMTLGPSLVIISPKYRHPLNVLPSAFMAFIVGRNIFSIHSSATSFV